MLELSHFAQTLMVFPQLTHPVMLHEKHGVAELVELKLYPEMQAEHTLRDEQAEQRGLLQVMHYPLRAEKPFWQTEQLLLAPQMAQFGTTVRLQAKQVPLELVKPAKQNRQEVPVTLQV